MGCLDYTDFKNDFTDFLILRRRQTRSFGRGGKHRFLRQAQDAEFMEVQYQPLPTAGRLSKLRASDRGKVEGLIL